VLGAGVDELLHMPTDTEQSVVSSELVLHTWFVSTATLSDLLRNPTEVIERLDDGDVVLTRRGAESLRLSKDRSTTQEHAMVAALAHLIAATVVDEAMASRLAEALRDPFPWIEFLDGAARGQFVDDFLRTARACASVGRFDRLAVEVANWRETAVAYSLGLRDLPSELDYLAERVEAEDPRVG
jgi:hypothetical protein